MKHGSKVRDLSTKPRRTQLMYFRLTMSLMLDVQRSQPVLPAGCAWGSWACLPRRYDE